MDTLRSSLFYDFLAVTLNTDGTIQGYKTWDLYKQPCGGFSLIYTPGVLVNGRFRDDLDNQIKHIMKDTESVLAFFENKNIIEILEGDEDNVLYREQ